MWWHDENDQHTADGADTVLAGSWIEDTCLDGGYSTTTLLKQKGHVCAFRENIFILESPLGIAKSIARAE